MQSIQDVVLSYSEDESTVDIRDNATGDEGQSESEEILFDDFGIIGGDDAPSNKYQFFVEWQAGCG